MLKLPDMYQQSNGAGLNDCFKDVLLAKSNFYKDTSTAESYIGALGKLRDYFIQEANALRASAESLPKIKFKATIISYCEVADKTENLGACLEPLIDIVKQIISKPDRPATWGMCPFMGPQWLFIASNAAKIMDSCAKLKGDFETEKATFETEKATFETEKTIEELILEPKRSEDFHMKLRSRTDGKFNN